MTYTQVREPNPDIECTPGWCLAYVNAAYDVPVVYGSATDAWNGSQTQHHDRDFPAGVAVPVWYGLDSTPLGHVVIRMPDGTVYSTSDLTNIPHHHPSLDDLEQYYAYYGMNLIYRGWTEDVENTPVITPTPQEDQLSAEFERDVRAALAQEKATQDAFRRDVRAELAVHRTIIEADRGLDAGQVLELVKKATINVTIGSTP